MLREKYSWLEGRITSPGMAVFQTVVGNVQLLNY